MSSSPSETSVRSIPGFSPVAALRPRRAGQLLHQAKYRFDRARLRTEGLAEGVWCATRNALAPGVIGLHRLDRSNIGDWLCSPFHYFQPKRPVYNIDIERHHASAAKWYSQAPIVIGGGGLYYFDDIINRLAAQHRGPLIGWSIGHNTHFGARAHQIDEEKFTLLGVRDAGTKYEWVPCVSCMAPLFDRYANTEPTREVVVYEHKDHPLNFSDFPVLTNRCRDLNHVLHFLARGATVITNSYHGAYWAQLLGRRVVAVAFSDRFLGFRYPISIATRDTALSQVANAAAYPEALTVSRQRNREFAAKVSEVIGIEFTELTLPRDAAC